MSKPHKFIFRSATDGFALKTKQRNEVLWDRTGDRDAIYLQLDLHREESVPLFTSYNFV